ncbi:MAG: proton-conducting transporter membrane subunit [Alphaproteobacteria bacterium]|nr:proton-conducting transporter membrane subunit [Alphaproteobacteria bacterium]
MSILPEPGALAAIAIAVPLIGAAGLMAARRWPDVREGISLASGVILFAIVALLAVALEAGETIHIVLARPLGGLSIALTVEPLGMLFALVASSLWIVTTVYAIGYMHGHHEKNQTRFYAFFAISIASVMGIAFAGNMLTLFVFYEVLTIATFPLVTHAGTPEARRAGRVYLGILLGTSIGFQMTAIIATYFLAGTLDFKPGGILEGHVSHGVAGVLLALYVFGVGKAALMPFHRWLPAAMVAPTPVSALLHAVAVVKAGVFIVLKIATFIFGFDLLRELPMTQILQWVAAFTIIAASLVAMTKDNLKARLAYSTVSQLAYIVLAALIADQAGFLGGGLHIATHAVGKITLFFCAGAILVAAHKTNISELDGIGRAMPLTMAAFMIGSLSIIGLPPFAGIWSKWFIFEGALEADLLFLVGVLCVSTLLNIAYLMPIPFRAFMRAQPEGTSTGVREAPLPCLVAIGVTSLGCLLLFLFPDPAINLLQLTFQGVGSR